MKCPFHRSEMKFSGGGGAGFCQDDSCFFVKPEDRAGFHYSYQIVFPQFFVQGNHLQNTTTFYDGMTASIIGTLPFEDLDFADSESVITYIARVQELLAFT